MDWILKIVEGPMAGAEIALVNGTRISFGSADTCDIVVADVALAPMAFLLDIGADGVTLLKGEDDADGEALTPFVIRTFGATAFVLGPSAGEWEELKKPEPKAEAKEPDVAAASPAGEEGRAESMPPPDDSAVTPSGTETPAATSSKSPYRLRACCCALVVLAVLVGVAWFVWPQIAEKCPAAEKVRGIVVERSKGLCSWVMAKITKPKPVVIPGPTLAEIAATHHLTLKLQPQPALAGNLRRRTERLAIRALALAADPRVKFDLTDDETLASATDALLFTVTEGAIKVVKAENRTASLSGKVGSRAQLEMVLRALSADVPGLEKVDAAQVTVVPGFRFESARLRAESSLQPDQPPVAIKQSNNQTIKQSLPVAGILTKPYACVVLHDGRRCVEGGYLGTARLVKIAADALTLENEGKQFEWKP